MRLSLPLTAVTNRRIKLRVVYADTQGLENEYDRLLASHDELQRRLSRLDPGVSNRTFGSESKTD